MMINCPDCNGNNIIKKGKRAAKLGVEQIYHCKNCKKTFVQKKFKNKTYDARVIVEAINCYNLGNTLEGSARLINRRYKIHTTKSTIHRWIQQYKEICTYHNLRNSMMKRYGKDIVVSKGFEYNGLAYNFRYHKGKLELLGEDFPSLVSYIRRFESGCPDFFDSIENRCSRLKIDVVIEKTSKENMVNGLASFALKACLTKRERHPIVENFMLLNDEATVAAEVPVWMWEKNLNLSIAGHIDILQVRNNLVYVLDYKPEATKQKDETVASQLYLYASGLSFRSSIPLDKFRCAWFDDKNYYEFEPKKAKVRYPKTSVHKKHRQQMTKNHRL